MTDDGFYIGHTDRAPPGHRRRLRGIAIGSFVIAITVAALFAAQQAPFVPSVFEFGTERELTGWLRETPAPSLVVAVPGIRDQPFALSSYLLVAPGKSGAHEIVRGLHGRHVRVRGTLAYLDGQTLLELSGPDAVAPLEAGAPAPTSSREPLGRLTFRGEIVDSKCHFGVMNPGTGKVHRACAARCLSGGIPPVLLARADDGGRLHLLITGEDGRAIGRELIPRVAEPVEVTGEVERIDGLLVLRAEPDAFVRAR